MPIGWRAVVSVAAPSEGRRGIAQTPTTKAASPASRRQLFRSVSYLKTACQGITIVHEDQPIADGL
jgi:hypothetical protein